ncbi:unnamed protein product [Choristocarpus tenellus]
MVKGCKDLAVLPEFAGFSNLRGVDVVAVRLFFRRKIPLPHAACVAGGGMAPGLESTGLTFYHLNVLQDEYSLVEESVIEVDFYHANPLVPMRDEDVMETALRVLNKAVPDLALSSDMLEDFAVVRAPQVELHTDLTQ